MIRDAHANTVLVYDAPPEVLDLAAERGLRVVYCFAIHWDSLDSQSLPDLRRRVTERVVALRAKPALLAWMLGNEVGGHALQTRGDAVIVDTLQTLYSAVKAVDRVHPVSHANWPPARHLPLGFFDFASFNLYPLWPPEVAAMGFGPFIQNVLRPIAGNKPLLITEFGVNDIEAGEEGQVRLLRESWNGLLAAGAAGGIVFEFADEWWKNWDNPNRPGDWWTRHADPNDEAQKDTDPEETYGLVRADRSKKPAFQAVAEMFGRDASRNGVRARSLAALSTLIVVAVALWAWAYRRDARRRAGS
jgi:O-antigen biosynthesis protein